MKFDISSINASGLTDGRSPIRSISGQAAYVNNTSAFVSLRRLPAVLKYYCVDVLRNKSGLLAGARRA